MSKRMVRKGYTSEIALLEARINDMKTRVMMIATENRLTSGFTVGMLKGFMLGIMLSLILFGVIFHYFVK